MKTKDLINFLNFKFNKNCAQSWDNVGLQTPIYNLNITGYIACLDVTIDIINKCVNNDYNFIISHHPIFLNEKHAKNIYNSKILKLLEYHKITVYSAHTNFDDMSNGLNEIILKKISAKCIKNISNHSGIIALVDKISIEDLTDKFASTFDVVAKYYKNNNKLIEKIAFCSGSGSSFLNEAYRQKVDVLITGDITYHPILEAQELNFNLIDVNHSIEKIAISVFNNTILEFKDIFSQI